MTADTAGEVTEGVPADAPYADAPYAPATTRRTDPRLLMEASVLLADAALAARRTGAELTAACSGWRFGVRAVRHPVWGLGAALAVGRAVTNSKGLGIAVNGGAVGEAVRSMATLTRREAAQVTMAVDAFTLRIEAATGEHPNLTVPVAKRLIDAVVAGRRVEALRAARELVRLLGVTRTLTTLSPVIMELLALLALLDENPTNDSFAWVTLAGGVPTTEPLLGLPRGLLQRFNQGSGQAERAEADTLLARVLARSENDIVRYIDDISALGNHGLALLRRIRCADGRERYVLLLPGTSFGLLRNRGPQDLVGAFDGLLRADTTYTRSVKHLLVRAGLPEGAELMIVGHSLGGITAMNLASDVDFVSTYRLTHVITVGSPIDTKRAVDPTVRVVSLVNKHDVIPGLDGRGPASAVSVPDAWLELTWVDETYDYPLSHSPQAYATTLRGDQLPYRTRVNELITTYDGEIVGNQPYQLFDK
ncbi:lipase family protein [Streptomyces anatolicus]|nr:lipase family protein [Streptomyces anatolicus]